MTRKHTLQALLLLPCLLCLSVAQTSGQVDQTGNQFWTDVLLTIPRQFAGGSECDRDNFEIAAIARV
jgi:hypothetical protein